MPIYTIRLEDKPQTVRFPTSIYFDPDKQAVYIPSNAIYIEDLNTCLRVEKNDSNFCDVSDSEAPHGGRGAPPINGSKANQH